MEVNKGEAERCRDIAARALRQEQYERAVKFFKKSLSLYPLPGVDALLAQSERLAAGGAAPQQSTSTSSSTTSSSTTAGNGSSARPSMPARSESAASSSASIGASGRSYTSDQENIVKKILKSKEGGRGAHYRVLGITEDASESDIKKAYRKMALKLHPDKNSAPHADEAFKAVGLAYATLSDTQKRNIYDRYGEEDPDNRGGGMRPGGGGAGGMHFRPGQEVNPEDIFNMFFGGGMPGGGMRGGPGVHFYSTGFGGPRGGFQGAQFRGRQGAQRGGGGERQQEPEPSPFQSFAQLIPFLLIMLLSFMNMSDSNNAGGASYGENKYFSLTQTDPFLNPLETKITSVKGIPYFVTNKFLRTYNRDRYQLAQVEKMVEGAYEKYLTTECNSQRAYKRSLLAEAEKKLTPEEQEKAKKIARTFELNRCVELNELYPLRHSGKRR